jgi:hypothetical protein
MVCLGILDIISLNYILYGFRDRVGERCIRGGLYQPAQFCLTVGLFELPSLTTPDGRSVVLTAMGSHSPTPIPLAWGFLRLSHLFEPSHALLLVYERSSPFLGLNKLQNAVCS